MMLYDVHSDLLYGGSALVIQLLNALCFCNHSLHLSSDRSKCPADRKQHPIQQYSSSSYNPTEQHIKVVFQATE